MRGAREARCRLAAGSLQARSSNARATASHRIAQLPVGSRKCGLSCRGTQPGAAIGAMMADIPPCRRTIGAAALHAGERRAKLRLCHLVQIHIGFTTRGTHRHSKCRGSGWAGGRAVVSGCVGGRGGGPCCRCRCRRRPVGSGHPACCQCCCLLAKPATNSAPARSLAVCTPPI